ncbi:MAG: hypothetical protein LBD67_04490 [Candidatus Accumulibacter sp.]|nr:hypothetical protein [Accumulibacter sp.]
MWLAADRGIGGITVHRAGHGAMEALASAPRVSRELFFRPFENGEA